MMGATWLAWYYYVKLCMLGNVTAYNSFDDLGFQFDQDGLMKPFPD
jgi:hypothetical protein